MTQVVKRASEDLDRIRVSSKQSIFFLGSNRNKQKLTVSVVFWFVSVFRTGIETTETNRAPKKFPKTALYQGVLETVNFSVEPKQTETQSVLVVFQCVQKQKKLISVRFGVSDRYRNNRNNKTYGTGN
jgi:hypothetical protein